MILADEIPLSAKFLSLFARLKDWSDDDPSGICRQASDDDGLNKLCHDIYRVARLIELDEDLSRQRYRSPVNPKFISEWRDFEQRWQKVLQQVEWKVILQKIKRRPLAIDATARASNSTVPDDFPTFDPRRQFELDWELADEEAAEEVSGFDVVMERAKDSVEDRAFDDEDYPATILRSVSVFQFLLSQTGLDLRGVLRRRNLTPQILIPQHVAQRHGEKFGPPPNESVSLYLLLQQAHEAFIFGAPLASIALMRALCELVLTHHYGFREKELDKKINRLRSSEAKTTLHQLRMLANDILHFGDDARSDPCRNARVKAVAEYTALLSSGQCNSQPNSAIRHERELISFLRALRDLVENSPTQTKPR